MPIIPILLGLTTLGGVYFFGKSQQPTATPDPVSTVTNLVLVGGVVFVAYRLFKK